MVTSVRYAPATFDNTYIGDEGKVPETQGTGIGDAVLEAPELEHPIVELRNAPPPNFFERHPFIAGYLNGSRVGMGVHLLGLASTKASNISEQIDRAAQRKKGVSGELDPWATAGEVVGTLNLAGLAIGVFEKIVQRNSRSAALNQMRKSIAQHTATGATKRPLSRLTHIENFVRAGVNRVDNVRVASTGSRTAHDVLNDPQLYGYARAVMPDGSEVMSFRPAFDGHLDDVLESYRIMEGNPKTRGLLPRILGFHEHNGHIRILMEKLEGHFGYAGISRITNMPDTARQTLQSILTENGWSLVQQNGVNLWRHFEADYLFLHNGQLRIGIPYRVEDFARMLRSGNFIDVISTP